MLIWSWFKMGLLIFIFPLERITIIVILKKLGMGAGEIYVKGQKRHAQIVLS